MSTRERYGTNSSGLRCYRHCWRRVCGGPAVEVLAEWGHCPGRRRHRLSPRISTTVVKASRNTEQFADGDAALTLTLAVASNATLTIAAKRSAYLKAVAMDPRCSLAWYKLGAAGGPDPSESHSSTLSNDEELANAKSMPLYECTRRALEIVLASDAAPPRG
jgi:hypothetical protein